MTAPMNTSSDFKQWLHAMKMVARLPGGTPPEFRKKLWLALADRHLHTCGIDWNKEQTKCLSDDTWMDDDEELGIQIVKDLHRTGSSLFTGPNGNINQAKLKRILLGYARWNPEVGYCQGFNMLGALILQVMDKNEIDALKVMIYLVEGVLPKGYFSGSLGGLQADMAVFREILSNRLPKLSNHLQRLQGSMGEPSFEPPLTNVFTMQWFLTLFCTCLPKNCVLRVWDLVLIEGSDILLRTALAIWTLLEERILMVKTADEFYSKMGTLSGELLNGHLFDSNGLIQKVVDLGPISELQKMREKHLYNITPWKNRQEIRVIYSDEDGDSDDDSWRFMNNARRGSLGLSLINRPQNETQNRINLDISILKKQYAKLRERHRQAHIILSTAARQTMNPSANNASPMNINQYLVGRNAIVSNKGKRIGPPAGSIPPVRTTTNTTNFGSSAKPTKYANKQTKRVRVCSSAEKTADNEKSSNVISSDNGNAENVSFALQKSQSSASSISSVSSASDLPSASIKPKPRLRQESSSYSEDDSDHVMADVNYDDDDSSSSTSTSLCDDDPNVSSSVEASPLKKRAPSCASNYGALSDDNSSSSAANVPDYSKRLDSIEDVDNIPIAEDNEITEMKLPPEVETSKIETEPVVTIDSHDESNLDSKKADAAEELDDNPAIAISSSSSIANLNSYEKELLAEALTLPQQITSTSQLSPIADIAEYLSYSCISPLKSPASMLYLGFDNADYNRAEICEDGQSQLADDKFQVKEDGVTNEYFERINQVSKDFAFQKPDEEFVNASESILIKDSPVTVYSPDHLDYMGSTTTEDVQLESEKSNIDLLTNKQLEWPSTELSELRDSTKEILNYDIMSKDNEHKLEEPIVEPICEDNSTNLVTTTCSSPTPIKNETFSWNYTESQIAPDDKISSFANNFDSSRNTDRVLKIIEENSQILHRIMNKNVVNEEETSPSNPEVLTEFTIPDNVMQSYVLPDRESLSESECLENNDTKTDVSGDFLSQNKYWNDYDGATSALVNPSSSAFSGADQDYQAPSSMEPMNMELNLSAWDSSLDGYRSDDQNDREDLLSTQSNPNDSPSQSIDHIVNSDSDYTVRNISACSGLIDKDESLPDVDENIYGSVSSPVLSDSTSQIKTSNFGESIVEPDDSLAMYSLKDTKISDYSYVKNRESRFSKYIDDVAAGLIPADETSSAIADYDLGSLPAVSKIDCNEQFDRKETKPDEPDYLSFKKISADLFPKSELDGNTNDSVAKIESKSDNTIPSNGDISATISSIKNTIKSIDSLCNDDQRRSRSRVDKTLEEIFKVVEQIDANRSRATAMDRSRPVSLVIDDSHASESKLLPLIEASERKQRYLSLPRCSRDRWRDNSPRRRNTGDDDFAEYESRVRRDKSPVSGDALPSDGVIHENDENYKDSNADTYHFHSYNLPKSLSPGISSPHTSYKAYGSNEKFEIRHTTVTATLYDRFLSQKRERQNRMDKSPSSPIITKAYLDSLKPDSREPAEGIDRNSKSAENSPNRVQSKYQFERETTPKPTNTLNSFLLNPQHSVLSASHFNSYTRSCDNIPSHFESTYKSSTNSRSKYDPMSDPIRPDNKKKSAYNFSYTDASVSERKSPTELKFYKKPDPLES